MRLVLLYSSVETSQLVHSGVQELYTGMYVTQRHYGFTLTHRGGMRHVLLYSWTSVETSQLVHTHIFFMEHFLSRGHSKFYQPTECFFPEGLCKLYNVVQLSKTFRVKMSCWLIKICYVLCPERCPLKVIYS